MFWFCGIWLCIGYMQVSTLDEIYFFPRSNAQIHSVVPYHAKSPFFPKPPPPPVVVGSHSPEGLAEFNISLAHERALHICRDLSAEFDFELAGGGLYLKHVLRKPTCKSALVIMPLGKVWRRMRSAVAFRTEPPQISIPELQEIKREIDMIFKELMKEHD